MPRYTWRVRRAPRGACVALALSRLRTAALLRSCAAWHLRAAPPAPAAAAPRACAAGAARSAARQLKSGQFFHLLLSVLRLAKLRRKLRSVRRSFHTTSEQRSTVSAAFVGAAGSQPLAQEPMTNQMPV